MKGADPMDEHLTPKRDKIEKEIREIVLADSRAILRDNLRRRRKKIGNIKKGDSVVLYEFFRNRRKERFEEGEFLYRIVEGRIIQVTGSGFFVDGVTDRGLSVREYVNIAHILSGKVRLIRKEKDDRF